jgi:hypothetical protein
VISTEKPGSPADLVHFGVKGMQWGVHKTQGTRDFYAKNPTSKQRTKAIETARESTHKTKTAYKKEKDPKKRANLKTVHLNNPDRPTALRLTRGEKVVLGLLNFTPGLNVLTSVGNVIAVGAQGKRRAVEK